MRVSRREIVKLAIVDDEPDGRGSFELLVEDADLEPVRQDAPLTSVADAKSRLELAADAVLCDHHLRKRNYAPFDGAELVAACFSDGLPAILCTRYERPDLEAIRPYREHIPVLLRPDEIEPEHLIEGLEDCVRELELGPPPHRRTWRTQIRVVDLGDVDQRIVYVEIPAWPVDERIGVPISMLPESIATDLREGGRLHARVNIGAELSADLFFTEWEPL
jgi:hypothetical protein